MKNIFVKSTHFIVKNKLALLYRSIFNCLLAYWISNSFVISDGIKCYLRGGKR